MSQEKNDKFSSSPFVALNTGHHLLGWITERNSSRAAAASLRRNSLATASCRTLTHSKNTTPVLLRSSYTLLGVADRLAHGADLMLL